MHTYHSIICEYHLKEQWPAPAEMINLWKAYVHLYSGMFSQLHNNISKEQ